MKLTDERLKELQGLREDSAAAMCEFSIAQAAAALAKAKMEKRVREMLKEVGAGPADSIDGNTGEIHQDPKTKGKDRTLEAVR